MAPRKCLFGCEGKLTLFSFPKEASTRQKWIELLFPGQQKKNTSMFVCLRHFTRDCFVNMGQYEAGLAGKLLLKDDAFPTLLGCVEESEVQAGISGIFCQTLPAVRHVACQTDPPETRPLRSVGTQLSMKTLQNHFRSTATQAKILSRDCGVCTRTFPLDSPLLLLQPTVVKRPSKRPRLSLTDEEEGP